MNYGKIFQQDFHKSFSEFEEEVSVDRIYDTTTGFSGHRTICDFQAYHFPFAYYFELKSYQGERITLSSVRENQYNGLLKKSKVNGVVSGVIFNFRISDKEQAAYFVDIRIIEQMKVQGLKSITLMDAANNGLLLQGSIKRIRFDYDVMSFLSLLSAQKEEELSGERRIEFKGTKGGSRGRKKST